MCIKLIIATSRRLREKYPNTEIFWSVFSRTRTEHGDLLCKFLYPVRIQENADQKNFLFGNLSLSQRLIQRPAKHL